MFAARLALFFASFFVAAPAFAQVISEADFARIAQRDPRAIFYFVSRGMPLSEPGVTNVSYAARAAGYRVYFVSDSAAPVRSLGGTAVPVGARTPALNKLGVYLHFPSMLLYKQGKLCGPPIGGYKSVDGYRRILARLDRDCARLPGLPQLTSRPERIELARGIMLKETRLPRETRFFFKAVDQNWVTYHDGGAYLFDRRDGREYQIPGSIDTVPSPDGMFMTIPGHLRFYDLPAMLANPELARKATPVFEDTDMTDVYQSVGLLRADLNSRFYRAITAYSSAVVYRDYTLDLETRTITKGAPPMPLCRGMEISLPLISKNGQAIGGREATTGHTMIFDIGGTGQECFRIHNTGLPTGKVSFDHARPYISYVSSEEDGMNLYVANYQTGMKAKLLSVTGNEILEFPDFLPNGNVLVMKKVYEAGVARETLIEFQGLRF